MARHRAARFLIPELAARFQLHLNTGSQDTRIEQVTMDGKVSRVARVAGIQRPATALGQWMGLTPDGTPLITRDLTAFGIHALRWRTK
jgi:hypothetical protein